MVKICYTYLLFILMPIMAWGIDDNVKITTEMDVYDLMENKPLKGTVSVTHNDTNPVDVGSFKLGGEPLKVEFLRNVKFSANSPLIISMYHFEAPAKKAGLYMLPEVSAKVGSTVYKSFQVSYHVQAMKMAPSVPAPATAPATAPAPEAPAAAPAVAQQQPAGASTLRLEAVILGPTTLYIGQRTKVAYRFLYTGEIELSKEVLPLLDAEGLKKVGDKQNRDYQEGNLAIREFSQEVEAVKAGTFSYGPSIIEGRAYKEISGKRVYDEKPLTSQAESVTITVLDVPGGGKPASFNGAIGEFTFTGRLTSNSQVTVGDKIQLHIEISGDPASISAVSLPELCCQPGFSGRFRPSDFPPVTSVQGNTKSFLVELRPLSTNIQEIPSIEFSSFDPATKKYVTIHSDSIPLKVVAEQTIPSQNQAPTPETDAAATGAPTGTPKPIEIFGNYDLTSSDLSDLTGGNWWILLLIPVGGVLLSAQSKVREDWLKNRDKVNVKLAQERFDEAMKEPVGSVEFYRKIKQAFLKRLVERHAIPSANVEAENLPADGVAGEVRALLLKLEENRFAGDGKVDPQTSSEVRQLFDKLKVT